MIENKRSTIPGYGIVFHLSDFFLVHGKWLRRLKVNPIQYSYLPFTAVFGGIYSVTILPSQEMRLDRDHTRYRQTVNRSKGESTGKEKRRYE